MEGIQRKFRLHQVNKWLRILNFSDITIDISYDNFTLLVQDKKVLARVNLILALTNRITNYGGDKPLSSQMLLSAFIISGYPREVLHSRDGVIIREEGIINDTMLCAARELVRRFNNMRTLGGVRSFHRMLLLYKDTFSIWKSHDRRGLLHTLTTTYYEIESLVSMVQGEHSEDYIVLCKERQEDIINKIIFLQGQEYFNNYRHEEITLEAGFQQHIKDILHKAYWDIFLQEISSTPPVYTQFIKILTEIRDTFCVFVPNRPDMMEEIRDKIDPDLIKNMVEHDAWDSDNLERLVGYIIHLIKEFQPPIMDAEVEEWEVGMRVSLLKDPLDYPTFLHTFFQSVFNMIQTIVGYLQVLHQEVNQEVSQD